MPYPNVRSSVATSGGSSASTNYVVSLPATVVAGDTIIVLLRSADGTSAFTWPGAAGVWNVLFSDTSDASNDRTAVAWKKATGSEGGTTITVTGTSAKYAACSWSIQDGADPTVTAPEFATLVTGSSNAPNAGNLTPSGGSKNYFWLTVMGCDGIPTVPVTYPTNYSIGQLTSTTGTASTAASNCRVAGAARQLAGSSENAGAFGLSTSPSWTATTIVVYPGTAVNVGYACRATAGFVTDPTGVTYTLGTATDTYPIIRGGFICGWDPAGSGFTVSGTDRLNSNPARLAGINFTPNLNVPFQIAIPNGTYDIRLAIGDQAGGTGLTQIDVYDGTTLLFSAVQVSTTANSFTDATGTEYTAANWDASNTPVSVTITQSYMRFIINPVGGSSFPGLAYFQITDGVAATGWGPLLGSVRNRLIQ